MSETTVSGNIIAKHDRFQTEGESYVIVGKSRQGWGLPVDNIEPQDLIALAYRVAEKRGIELVADKSGWQPIETAPTDDTVLVFGNGCISMAYLCESGDGWKNSHNSRSFDMCRLPLTHWKPLPEPPKEANNDG